MMPKEKKIAAVDPTVPYTEIVIEGKTYKMCFDYQALADGDQALALKGINSQLLLAMPKLQFWSVRLIFAVSLERFHAEVPYQDRLKLVTPGNLWPIANAIQDAWNSSMPEAEPEEAAPSPDPQPAL